MNKYLKDRIEKTTDCWNWVGCIGSEGYGRFMKNYKEYLAHRVVYELFKGKIKKGLHIDHLCRNRRCVNPNHLEQVTSRENVLRGEGLFAKNLRKTHCKHGHEFSGKNLILIERNYYRNGVLINRGKGRKCRICFNKTKLKSAHKMRKLRLNK